jgi:hypothetical protein
MNILDELECNTGIDPGMTPLECLRAFPAARAKLLELVPELIEDVRTMLKENTCQNTTK